MKVILLYYTSLLLLFEEYLGNEWSCLISQCKKAVNCLMFRIVPISGDFHFSNLPTARNCRPSVRNFATLAKTMIEGYPSVFELRQNCHWNYNFENKDSKLFPCQACQRASYIFAEIPITSFSRIICNLQFEDGTRFVEAMFSIV